MLWRSCILYADTHKRRLPSSVDAITLQMGEYLQLEVGEDAHERRHSVDTVSYASKIILIPAMRREVAGQLSAVPMKIVV